MEEWFIESYSTESIFKSGKKWNFVIAEGMNEYRDGPARTIGTIHDESDALAIIEAHNKALK